MRTVILPIRSGEAQVTALVEHLLAVRENDRVDLGRELHDEVGTLLVAAAMELGWVSARATVPALSERLQRLGGHLADAIRINRRTIDTLRPTLLDTFGLFEALRWCFKNACHDVPVRCSVDLPDREIETGPYALTQVFRAVQILLECTLMEEQLSTLSVEATLTADALAIRLAHRHVETEPSDVLERFRLELASASHRIAAVGGELSLDTGADGACYDVNIPLQESRLP